MARREMRWFGKRTEGSLGFPQEFYSLFPGLPPRSVFYQTSLTDAYPQYGPYLTQGPGADQDALREQNLAALAAHAALVTTLRALPKARKLVPTACRLAAVALEAVDTRGLSPAVEKRVSEALAALSEFDALELDANVERYSDEIRALRQLCHEAREGESGTRQGRRD